MALFTFNDNFQINAPKHIDTRYLNLFTPWASTAAVNAAISPFYRYLGLTVLIGSTEYWYQTGVADVDLIPKLGGGGFSTADNGLTNSTASNIQLGGTIIQDTLLSTIGTNFKIYIDGDSATVSPFVVSSSGVAPSMTVQNTNGTGGIALRVIVNVNDIGVYASSSTAGVSIIGTTTDGIGGFFNSGAPGGTGVSILAQNSSSPLVVDADDLPSQLIVTPVSNGGVKAVLQVVRQSSSGGASNGIGGSIEFYNRMSNSSLTYSNVIISELTNATTGSIDSQLRIQGMNTSVLVDKLMIGPSAILVNQTRFETYKGANIVAANNLTLGTDGNMFTITGNTQINAITIANWQPSSRISFIFTGTPTLKHNTAGGGGTASLILAGSVDYVAAAGDYIAFEYDGSTWHETSRRLTASGGVYTFSNGLTESPATQVKLGGTLTAFTTINTTTGFALTISGNVPAVTSNGTLVVVNNDNTGQAVYGSSTGTGGIGVRALSNTGHGIYSDATSGTAIRANATSGTGLVAFSVTGLPLQAFAFPATTNTVVTVLNLIRGSSVSPLSGIGGSIDFTTNTTIVGQVSNQLISKWTTAVSASRTSDFILTGVNNAVTADLLTISGNGRTRLNKYGVGSFTAGTPVYSLQVDSSGNLMEVVGGSGFLTADNGLTANTATNVRLGGTLVTNTTIAGAAFTLTVSGTGNANNTFTVSHTGSGATGTSSAITANNTRVGGVFQGANIGVNAAANGGNLSNVALRGIAIGGIVESHGVYGEGDQHGVHGVGNIGVYGVPFAGSGQAGVLGDGSANGVYGVWSINGLYAQDGLIADGSTVNSPVYSQQLNTDSLVHPALTLWRGGTITPVNGLGTSIEYIMMADDSLVYVSNILESSWSNISVGTRDSKFRITGVTATVTQDWLILKANGIWNICQPPPVYANNAAALSGGLGIGDLYRNGDALNIVH